MKIRLSVPPLMAYAYYAFNSWCDLLLYRYIYIITVIITKYEIQQKHSIVWKSIKCIKASQADCVCVLLLIQIQNFGENTIMK